MGPCLEAHGTAGGWHLSLLLFQTLCLLPTTLGFGCALASVAGLAGKQRCEVGPAVRLGGGGLDSHTTGVGAVSVEKLISVRAPGLARSNALFLFLVP